MPENKKTNVAELTKAIGKKALWQADNGLFFEVVIKDVEVFYGQPYYMIAPVSGSGFARVRDRIRIEDK